MLPPLARVHSPADTIPVRHLHQSIGKSKKPITVVRWTPEGRRLLTGGHTGEFMLWNGTAFNFETVMDVCVSMASFSYPWGAVWLTEVLVRRIMTNYKQVLHHWVGRTARTG